MSFIQTQRFPPFRMKLWKESLLGSRGLWGFFSEGFHVASWGCEPRQHTFPQGRILSDKMGELSASRLPNRCSEMHLDVSESRQYWTIKLITSWLFLWASENWWAMPCRIKFTIEFWLFPPGPYISVNKGLLTSLNCCSCSRHWGFPLPWFWKLTRFHAIISKACESWQPWYS